MQKKILLVDDDFGDLNKMKGILEKNGYQATIVTNGARAIDILAAHNFDLVLIDIIMPTFSGYDLIRMIKDRIKRNFKIAFVSIIPMKEADISCSDGYIQKPFSEKTFIEEVKRLMGR